MNRDDRFLLEPGVRVRIGPKLLGAELYGGDDPEEFKKWCGQEATVRRIHRGVQNEWFVGIEEDMDVEFYIDEIECIVDDSEITESDAPLDVLLDYILDENIPRRDNRGTCNSPATC